MRVQEVEIYSDATNHAVLRHPERRFPGLLIQGDTLYSLCAAADRICAKACDALDAETFAELNQLRSGLRERLTHYKDVLRQHDIPLPFSETP